MNNAEKLCQVLDTASFFLEEHSFCFFETGLVFGTLPSVSTFDCAVVCLAGKEVPL